MESSIKQNSAKSLRWSTLGAILPKIINPVISLSLINIIDSKEYGLLAIVTYIINFINIIQGFGFFEFIIKEKAKNEENDNILNSIFWSNLFFSVIIYIFIIIITPILSKIYQQEKLVQILPISSLILLINALQLINMSFLHKNMEFKKIFLLQTFPTIILFCITYPLAKMHYGVWSFVYSQLITGVLTIFLYFYFTTWRPKFFF